MIRVHSVETFGTHDGPGIRLVIFLQGCPMKCLYCHNPDTQSLLASSKEYSQESILELLEQQRPYFSTKGGLTLSGGEPTVQASELIELLKKVKSRGFHTALDTNGVIFSPTVNQLYDLTDLIILDVKHIDREWHTKLTGVSNKNVLKSAAYREKSGKPMWLRYVVVPGWTDQKEYVEAWARHFKNFTTIEKIEILPYHTFGVHKYESLGMEYGLPGVNTPSNESLQRIQSIFEKYLSNVVIV